MARPIKKGLDYFQADVDMFRDRRIKRLLRSAGSKGFTVYIYLLTCIYGDEGYFYEWDEHSAFDISDELNFSESAVEESVKACCSIGLFHGDMFSAQSILTSESIQKRWQKIVKDAKRNDTEVEPQFQLPIEGTVVNSEETKVNSELTELHTEESTQSKVKESKVDTTTTNAREEIQIENEDWEPPSLQEILRYAENHAIPEASARYYFLAKEAKSWLWSDKNGNEHLIRDWTKDLNFANQHGWIHNHAKKQRQRNGTYKPGNQKRGDDMVEQVNTFGPGD